MPKKKVDLPFAQAFEELESIAGWFEKGEPDLETGMDKFERATELAQLLKERLKEAENRIKEIRLRAPESSAE